jgi:sigma-B regulation protein RsbU (phosphoserine phosphatase)
MKLVNEVLLSVLPEGKYLTACYLTLNRKTRVLKMVNMGHPPVLHVPVAAPPRLLDDENDILGAYHGPMFNEKKIRVKKGDRLFIYTDGLIEDGTNTVWTGTVNKIIEHAEKISGKSLTESIRKINDLFFPEDRQPEDDIIIMGIEV